MLSFSGCTNKADEIKLQEPKAVLYQLDNGLNLIINEDHRHPVVAVYALVDVGSAKEGKYTGAGISHFIEHMLFKGTDKLQVGEFHSRVSGLGGETNAATSFDYTGFYITAPSSGFKEALNLLSDVIMNSGFDEAEFLKERNVILREMDMYYDEPSSLVIKNLFSQSYIKHPYKYPVIGNKDLYLGLTRDDLFDFYKENYTSDNIIISITGDIDTEDTYNSLKDIFKSFSGSFTQRPPVIIEPPQVARKENIIYSDVNLGYLALGYKSISIYDPDLYALDVLAIALGGGRGSILPLEIEKNQGLVYGIASYNYTPENPGLFIIDASFEANNYEKVLEAINKELEKIKKRGISQKELERAKKIALSNEINTLDTYEAQAKDLAHSYMMTKRLNFSNIYIEKIQEVSQADVKRVANKYLHDNKLTISAILPQSNESNTEGKLDQDSSNIEQDVKVKKIILENGLRLLIAKDASYPTVNIRATFKGGLRYENRDNNGISQLLAGLLPDLDYKGKTISGQLENRGGSISAYSQNNTCGISLQVLKPDVDFSLEILNYLINNVNGISEADISHYKELQLAAIKAQNDDVFAKTFLTLRNNFFIDHPYQMGHLGSKETINSINEEQLLNFYSHLLDPPNMIICVFGDIDENRVETKLKKYFSGLKPAVSGLDVKLAKNNHLSEKKDIFQGSADQQAIVMIAYPAPETKSPDRFAFEVLSKALSGGDSRLFYNLRDVGHLAYSVGTFSMLGYDPGCLVFYLATSPQQAQEAKLALLNEIAILKKSGLKQEEINKAKKELIGQYAISLQTSQQLAFQCTLDELYFDKYDKYLDYESQISQVSDQDIKRVIDKYLNPEESLILVSSAEKNL
jgi:zinc protease